jgi:hypothetical protein
MRMSKPLAAVATAGLVAVGGMAALPSLASAAPVATVSHTRYGVWPAQCNGVPTTLKAGAAKGFYLWHSKDGWRLEVTHPGNSRVVFTGEISTDGTLKYNRVGDEPGDLLHLGPHGHDLYFSFSNYGHLDGVHFTTSHATKLTFHLAIDGKHAVAKTVAIGSKGLHPTAVPFTVDRTGIR